MACVYLSLSLAHLGGGDEGAVEVLLELLRGEVD